MNNSSMSEITTTSQSPLQQIEDCVKNFNFLLSSEYVNQLSRKRQSQFSFFIFIQHFKISMYEQKIHHWSTMKISTV